MRLTIHFSGRAAIAVCALAFTLAACDDREKQASRPPAPVKAQILTTSERHQSVALTGEVRARVQSNLAFRFSGRIAERFVEVGENIVAGQVLARLEAQEQTADVASATAGVQAAEATLRQTTAAFERQKTLLAGGFTTQSNYDNAQQALRAARATLDAARSNLGTAQEQLFDTDLRADAPGVVVARNAEAGQVVEAAQTVFTVARDGARDAVFSVHEGLLAHSPTDEMIELALISNPAIRAVGRVREVAPAIDPETGTVRVKVAIDAPPPAMTLGAAVTGVGRFRFDNVFVLPASAFFTEGGRPAVWAVDPHSHTAAIRPITVDSYRTGELLVRSGLEAGDIVVTAGAQLLRPGQTVNLLIPGKPATEAEK